MKCSQFHKLLEQAIDERSSARRNLLKDHADHCDACRTAWQDHLRIESALATWSEPVHIDLVDRVVAAALLPPSEHERKLSTTQSSVHQLRRTKQNHSLPDSGSPGQPASFGRTALFDQHSRTPASRFRGWLTVSTVTIVLTGIAFMLRTSSDHIVERRTSPVPHSQQITPVLQATENRFTGMNELLADTRSAWDGIARKTDRQRSRLSVFVPDLNSQFAAPAASFPREPVEPPREETPDRPFMIPDGVNRAFNFLIDMSSESTPT